MALTPVTAMYGQAQQANALYNETARKQAAFNALRRTYGDMAGDPQAALQMQSYGFNEQANPLRLDDMQISNALNQQSFDFNEQYNPLRIEGAQLTNEGARTENRGAEDELRRKAFVDGARYVKRRMNEGADVGSAFDEVAPFLPATDEQKSEIRRTLAANPSELDTFLETLGADEGVEAGLNPIPGVDEQGNPVLLQTTKSGRAVQTQMPPGVTVSKEPIRMDAGDRVILLDPITRRVIDIIPKGGAPSADQSPVMGGGAGAPAAGQGPQDGAGAAPGAPPASQQAPVRLAPTPGSKLDREMQAESAEADKKRLERQRMLGHAGQTVLRSVTRSLDDYLPNVVQGDSVLASTQRFAAQYIPGSAEFNLSRQINDFSRNIGLDRLQQMRETSPKGGALGQVPVQQQQRLEEVLGSFDVAQQISVLEENLKQLNNIYMDITTGSSAERAALVESGELSSEENARIESLYYDTEFDEFGRRREGNDRGESGGLGDLSDDELRQRYDELFGGGR